MPPAPALARGADARRRVSRRDQPGRRGGFLNPASVIGDDSPKYQRLLKAAKKLRGSARLKASGKLDIALMKYVAPVVVMRTFNNLYFFSERVDPRSLVYKSVYFDWSIPALALK